MTALHPILYPELRALPPGDREAALREARRTPFDVIELLGIATGLVIAAALAASAATAAPLVVLLAGPFVVRRVRRGLRRALERGPAAR